MIAGIIRNKEATKIAKNINPKPNKPTLISFLPFSLSALALIISASFVYLLFMLMLFVIIVFIIYVMNCCFVL